MLYLLQNSLKQAHSLLSNHDIHISDLRTRFHCFRLKWAHDTEQVTWTSSSSIMADELIFGYDHSAPQNIWIKLFYY